MHPPLLHLPPSTGPVSVFHAIVFISFVFTSHCPLHLYTNYFCSVVHSVWGWTRTPPWPPVRGERLSGTKTSLAPLFFLYLFSLFLFLPSSYPMIDEQHWQQGSVWKVLQSADSSWGKRFSEDTGWDQTEVYVSLIRLRTQSCWAKDQIEALRFSNK